ncbi:MAG: histidine kinase N-terminal 7TM domain-containing protein [Candidatus Pacebacteria bacterium]|jgi:hypothetical protein|nr:histidine kinase N-terminal 7TM domain-containing protein [Candidatus Paceibacterota bacterium]MDD4831180.1 histidine kinase N-terminal 7TM domain-containing protein [Candidatus Paceibacterota bacterium]MDD4874819.1 histidine kinase N-terminal 7TM domain-containing protein [Candidatus Paceibacterota bacterium]
MTFFSFSALFNFFISLILGGLIFFKDRKRKESRLFAYWALSIVVWSIGYYFWQIASDKASALFWCRFLTVGSVFISICYFHFVASILKITEKNKLLIFFSYIFAIFLSLASAFTPYMVKEVAPRLFFEFWPIAGSLYKYFLLLFFGLFGYAWLVLYLAFKKISTKPEKIPLRFLLFGVFFGVIGGSTNFPLWYDIPVAPYGNIAVSIFLAITAGGLIRYQLLNVKAILTEILVVTMGLTLAVFPFFITEQKIKIAATTIFIFFCFVGYLLIKATLNEIAAKEGLEEKVKERTKELEASKKIAEERAEELERWYKLTIGRELRMAELKEKIKEMEDKGN